MAESTLATTWIPVSLEPIDSSQEVRRGVRDLSAVRRVISATHLTDRYRSKAKAGLVCAFVLLFKLAAWAAERELPDYSSPSCFRRSGEAGMVGFASPSAVIASRRPPVCLPLQLFKQLASGGFSGSNLSPIANFDINRATLLLKNAAQPNSRPEATPSVLFQGCRNQRARPPAYRKKSRFLAGSVKENRRTDVRTREKIFRQLAAQGFKQFVLNCS